MRAATNKLRASLRALRVFAVNSDSPLPLFPDELEDDFPIARPVVEVDKNQLLPCAQQQFTAFERDGQARLHQGGTDVAVAVHIPPALVMLVVDSSGRDTFDRGAEVMNRAGFKFDRRYGCSGSRDESIQNAVLKRALAQGFLCQGRDVQDLCLALGLHALPVCPDRHRTY